MTQVLLNFIQTLMLYSWHQCYKIFHSLCCSEVCQTPSFEKQFSNFWVLFQHQIVVSKHDKSFNQLKPKKSLGHVKTINKGVWFELSFFFGQPHLLAFPKTHILDLITLLYHPTKVPLIGFDFLLKSFSANCARETGKFSGKTKSRKKL